MEAKLDFDMCMKKSEYDNLLYLEEETAEENMLRVENDKGKHKTIVKTLAFTLKDFKYKTFMWAFLGEFCYLIEEMDINEAEDIEKELETLPARDIVLRMSDLLKRYFMEIPTDLFPSVGKRAFLFYRDIFSILIEKDSNKQMLHSFLDNDEGDFNKSLSMIQEFILQEYYRHCFELGVISEDEMTEAIQ